MVRAKAREMLRTGADNVTRPCTPPTAQRTLFEHPSERENRFESQQYRNSGLENAPSRQHQHHPKRHGDQENIHGVSEREEDEQRQLASRTSRRSTQPSSKPTNDINRRQQRSSSSSSNLRPSSSSSSHRDKEGKHNADVFDAGEQERINEA
jgi:hypothetical protein